jgi:hypothetical protein
MARIPASFLELIDPKDLNTPVQEPLIANSQGGTNVEDEARH